MTLQSVGARPSADKLRFEAIYREYEPVVLAYALRRAPVGVALDAVAEVFLVAWRRLDVVPPDALPWLLQTARKVIANERRSINRQLRLIDRVEADARSHQQTDFSVRDSCVAEALAELSAADREVLLLVAWDGLTPSEAAESAQCSAVAFRVRFHRARRRFERALDHFNAGRAIQLAPQRRDQRGVKEVL